MAMKVRQSADERTGQWQHHLLAEPASTALLAEILAKAAPQPNDRCVDLGAGSGTLTLVLAGEGGELVGETHTFAAIGNQWTQLVKCHPRQ